MYSKWQEAPRQKESGNLRFILEGDNSLGGNFPGWYLLGGFTTKITCHRKYKVKNQYKLNQVKQSQ